MEDAVPTQWLRIFEQAAMLHVVCGMALRVLSVNCRLGERNVLEILQTEK